LLGSSRAPAPALALAAAALLGATVPARLDAQQPPFLHTVTPVGSPGGARTLVSANLGYGERLFAAIGPERWEQRLGAQLALGSRFTLVAAGGFAPQDASVTAHTSAAVELLTNLLPTRSRAFAALGLGGMLDYSGSGVALGRLAAGVRWPQWELAGNVRLERSLAPASARRDALDVITSVGLSRRLARPLRVGLEAVGEDLEGIFDPNEAEGGAKVMLGPTLAVAPNAHWQLLVGGGPVLRLSQSLVTGAGSSVPRELITRSGYVIRSSVSYAW
jgi:hypothetical protein